MSALEPQLEDAQGRPMSVAPNQNTAAHARKRVWASLLRIAIGAVAAALVPAGGWRVFVLVLVAIEVVVLGWHLVSAWLVGKLQSKIIEAAQRTEQHVRARAQAKAADANAIVVEPVVTEAPTALPPATRDPLQR
jgi:hypothetical protein